MKECDEKIELCSEHEFFKKIVKGEYYVILLPPAIAMQVSFVRLMFSKAKIPAEDFIRSLAENCDDCKKMDSV